MAAPIVLGTVTYRQGTPAEGKARLLSNLTWKADDAATAAELNLNFNDYSPAHGQRGRKLLLDAAAYLRGSPTWLAPEPRPMPSGTIY